MRVLCVDDSPDDADLNILALQRHGYDVDGKRVDKREDAQSALLDEEWDLILCDYSMPSFSAIVMLELIKELNVDVPCLIVSPYAKQGYVSHTSYEFGSILKFIEEAFALPALGSTADGYTDRRAKSIADSFDFTQSPRAFSPIPAKYPMSRFLTEPPSDEPVDTQ